MSISLLEIAMLLIVLILVVYYKLVIPHSYWKKRGLQCENPHFILGKWGPVLSQICCTGELFKLLYDKHPEKCWIPLYQLLRPVVLIKDPKIIKHVTITNFDFFTNRTTFISESVDPLAAKTMFFLSDEDLKHIRSVISPAFTTNKLKVLYHLMVECVQEFTAFYSKDEVTTVEAKSAFSKVTNDIIASTAFGVKINSMKIPGNDIYVKGQKIILNGFIPNLKFLLFSISPYFTKLFNVRVFDENICYFFKSIITETIQYREKNGIVRPDILHLMMEARKGNLTENTTEDHKGFRKPKSYHISDELLAAQCLIFYVGGFDSTSTALSFLSHELALNPDIQERLFNEVLEVFQKNQGKITYEALLSMKYLDMVIYENLRKWPPGAMIERKSSKPFNLSMETGEYVWIDEGVSYYTSIYALHRDPTYWPNPEKFDPERFSKEKKPDIRPYTYIPFESGPRN